MCSPPGTSELLSSGTGIIVASGVGGDKVGPRFFRLGDRTDLTFFRIGTFFFLFRVVRAAAANWSNLELSEPDFEPDGPEVLADLDDSGDFNGSDNLHGSERATLEALPESVCFPPLRCGDGVDGERTGISTSASGT